MKELRENNLFIYDYHHRIAVYYIGKKLINNKLYLQIKNKSINLIGLQILYQELNKFYERE
jgi:hypothetical protein